MEASELRTLLERHHRQSFGWALSCCRHERQRAEEVLQTVYLKILEGKACFDGTSAFKTWIFSIIRKTAADERRKELFRRLRFTSYNEYDQQIDGDTTDILMERSELQSQFLRAVDSLPKRQREVLHLVFYQDLTLSGAAEVMRISLGSARTHYDRAKKRIRQLMEESHAFGRPGPTGKQNQRIVPTPETGR